MKAALRDDAGQAAVFTLILVPALLLIAALLLDAGLALSAKTRALDVAQAAARAGAQHLDLAAYRNGGAVRLDAGRASAAAGAWLVSAGMTGEVTVAGASVTVTAHTTRRTQLLQLVGVRELHMSASATATARRGVSVPDP